jgi:hypothetical protein
MRWHVKLPHGMRDAMCWHALAPSEPRWDALLRHGKPLGWRDIHHRRELRRRHSRDKMRGPARRGSFLRLRR